MRPIVVDYTAKVQIFEQITTDLTSCYLTVCCWLYRKGTNFRANHNVIGIILINGNVVDYTAKVQIFEQITTQKNHFHKSYQDAVADGHRGRTLQSTTMGVCLLSKFWKNTNYAEHFYGPAHFSHPITTQPKWVPAPAWPPIFNRQKYFTNGRRRIDFFQSSRLLFEKSDS